MLMLRKGSEVTRDQLRDIQTPEPTDSWCPVSHFDVVNTLTDRAAACGLKILQRIASLSSMARCTP